IHDKGFLLSTLRAADEVHDARPYFAEIEDSESDPEMLGLAKQLIKQKTGKLQPEAFHDRYQDAVRELIQAKIAGQEPVVAAEPEHGGKVIDLMEALKRSLKGDAGEERKPPAQSKTARRAA